MAFFCVFGDCVVNEKPEKILRMCIVIFVMSLRFWKTKLFVWGMNYWSLRKFAVWIYDKSFFDCLVVVQGTFELILRDFEGLFCVEKFFLVLGILSSIGKISRLFKGHVINLIADLC